jgi:spore germination protein KB
MRKYRLSGRQFSWLIAAYIMTPAIINLPQHLARTASMDAWITQLLPVLYGFAVCYVFYRLARLFPGKNFFEINFKLAGKWGGGLLNGLLLLHLWFILARDTTMFTGFIKTNLLLRTPYEVTLLLLMIVLIYYGKTSVEVTARVNDIFFGLLCLMVLFLPLLVSNDISIYQMQPILIEPPADLTVANALSTSYYGDVIAFGAFLPAIGNSKLLFSAFRHGLALTAALITWIIVTCLCVLGPNIMSKEVYPTYALIQQIHITDFLDRLEIVIFSAYFPSFIVNITLSFFAILIGLASFTKSNNYQFYSKPVGWLTLLTLVFAFGGTPEVAIFANYGFPVFLFAVQPLAILVTLLLSWRKSKQLNHSEASKDTADDKNPETRRSLQMWRRVTHIVIVAGLGFVVIGWFISKDYQWLAKICAIGYLLALLATVYSTFMEKSRADKL